MGSVFELIVCCTSPEEANKYLNLGLNEIERIEKLLSEFLPETATTLINNNAGIAPVIVNDEVFWLLERCMAVSALTQGAFDISYGVYKQDLTLVPISFDLGSRSEFDGWYYDFYLGLSILPFGNKKDVKPQFLQNRGVETMFDPVSFHIALCFGVSWAD